MKSRAVTGSPFDQQAFLRRWNVYVLLSSDTSQLSATPGSGLSVLASTRVNPSKMLPIIRCSGKPVTAAQSRDFTSLSLINVKSAGGNWPLRTAQLTAPRTATRITPRNQVRPDILVI